ncbi:MAG: aminotransferase class V-fold PLP-dependent enzyme, partial [Planctomycetota bacterium]|nr:aminotransferase class V-fold PLP-dependent enzyme [Planctomycetota bacterium]
MAKNRDLMSAEEIQNPELSPLEVSGAQIDQWLQQVIPELRHYLDSLPRQETWATENYQEVLDAFDLAISDQSESFQDLVEFLFHRAIPCSFNTASQGYLAYVPGGGLPQSGIAELISTVTNRYIGVWAAAPILANIEQSVIRWFCDLYNFPAQAGGLLTSGGSLANWNVMVAARIKRLGEEFHNGTIYCSDQAHHCIHKAARLCGIKRANVRVIQSDHQFCLDTEQLERTIQKDISIGLKPFLLIANGGSTNSGAVDPLPRMAAIAKQHDLWFHVDAAYGGFFVLTPAGRERLAGIELADSIVVDPHKGMFLPYGVGSLIVRNVKDLSDVHRIDAYYLPSYQNDHDKTDFHEISPELSRDFRGLRVWLPLKMHGVEP